MKSLEEILDELLQKEESSTGGGTTTGATATAGAGEQYFSKVRVKKIKEDAPMLAAGKVKHNYAVEKFGYKLAPSIPNRKSGMIDYKQLYENTDMVVSALNNPNLDPDVKKMLFYGYQEGHITAEKVLDIISKLLNVKGINENYSQFRNETKTRSKPEQFHQAVKAVKKRVQEINRLFEYVDRLKSELNEAGDGLKYKKHTENALTQIKEMVTQLHLKARKFK